ELRRRKWRRDAGLLDPDQAVAGPRDGFLRRSIGHTNSRPKIQLVQLARGSGTAVASEIFELLGLEVEHRGLIVRVGRGEVERITHAGVERRPAGKLPIVLEEQFCRVRPRSDRAGLDVDREALHLAKQKTRQW